MATRFQKAIGLLTRPSFAKALLLYRVAASVEHLSAIRTCGANTLLDAGVNKGQFSLAFRHLRPNALIVAFDQVSMARAKLMSSGTVQAAQNR